MNKIDIKIPTSWQDVNIRKFEKLTKIDKENPNADFEMISILCDLDLDVVEHLNVKDYGMILNKLAWTAIPPAKHKPSKQLLVNERVINITLSHEEMTAAQFLDYKTILSTEDIDRKTARLCACFMIPDGHTYNDGYNANEWIDFLNENISVVEVQSYTDFFMLVFNSFATAFLTYSIKEAKKMKNLTQEEKKKLITPLEQTLHLIKSGGFL